MSDGTLRRTPLYEAHRAAGGKLVPFAGWEMPVQFSGLMEEHRAVRTAAGLFDVSHMGEIRVWGRGAESFLQALTPNDVARLQDGRAHYSGLLTERGTYLDDLLVYRRGEGEYLLVVNAANRQSDFAHIAARAAQHEGVEVADHSDDYALLALQGPKAVEILAPLASFDVAGLRYYGFGEGEVDGVQALISRTGYTGEDGYELYVAPQDAIAVWNRLMAQGESSGLLPAGLGARDTLRLEAAMALYGHELDDTTTPFEAGLGWVVKIDKGEFLGRQALVDQKAAGVPRKLIGFEVTGKGIAREGHGVLVDGRAVGTVTSGTWSPTFEKALGLAYVEADAAAIGGEISLEVRGRSIPARQVETPFYRRPKG
ncbi:MAG: glycine cleavage system aminomethyltransferase GcvT [Acidobacteriota bacterium]